MGERDLGCGFLAAVKLRVQFLHGFLLHALEPVNSGKEIMNPWRGVPHPSPILGKRGQIREDVVLKANENTFEGHLAKRYTAAMLW
jgi:hypothetical protein